MALYLTPSGVTAEPTNVKVGVATISGSLVMDKIPGERLIANLKGTTDRGWPSRYRRPTWSSKTTRQARSR